MVKALDSPWKLNDRSGHWCKVMGLLGMPDIHTYMYRGDACNGVSLCL